MTHQQRCPQKAHNNRFDNFPAYVRSKTVFELKAILRSRGLKCSGTKPTLAARVVENDESHTFSFLDLPPEIRNLVYSHDAQYVITSTDSAAKDAQKYEVTDLMILQPGLCRASRQTRLEGLPIFYNQHRFEFKMCGGPHCTMLGSDNAFNATPKWLSRIGERSRMSVRQLVFNSCFLIFDGEYRQLLPEIEILHKHLSQEATMVYESTSVWGSHKLWEAGRLCQFRDSTATTHFYDLTCLEGAGSYDAGYWTKLSFLPGSPTFGDGVVAVKEEGVEGDDSAEDALI